MKFRACAFNIYFILCASLAWLGAGCKTTGDKKKQDQEATAIRFHLEVNPDGTGRSAMVPIFREKPMMVNVWREAFLDEGSIQRASVVDAMGGFALQLEFDRHGTWLLENATTSYKGQRIGIVAHFGETRWLGAPLIRDRITNGVFVFTPDATQEEAERIARGLNNVVRTLQKKALIKDKPSKK